MDDLDEVFDIVREMGCFHYPTYTVYDRVSKIHVYMDSSLGHQSYINHICWVTEKLKQLVHEKHLIYPQADFKEGTIVEGIDEPFKPMREALVSRQSSKIQRF